MTKNEFITALERKLSVLPKDEREKSISYYSELIDDKIEGGMSEGEAVGGLDAPEAIAEMIIREFGVVKPKKKTVNTVLIIAGSPVWVPLLIAFAAVIFALYVSVWAIVVSLFAADFSFAVAFICGIIGFFPTLSSGVASAFMLLGCGLVCGGLAVLMFIPLCKLSKLICHATAAFFRYIKSKISERRD